MTAQHVAALQGIAAAAAAANALFFVRFWRQQRDRLFVCFGAAFALLALSWGLLAFTDPTDETRPYIYGARLVAFLLVIAGMVDKNRQR